MNTRMLGWHVVGKFSPDRLKVSPKFTSILACLLGVQEEEWASPVIEELCLTSDGMLMGRLREDIGFNEILGSREDLERNMKGVADALNLSPEEREKVAALISRNLQCWCEFDAKRVMEV